MIELPAPTRIRLPRPPDRQLFVAAAIGTLVIVFAGFACSYFLKFLPRRYRGWFTYMGQ